MINKPIFFLIVFGLLSLGLIFNPYQVQAAEITTGENFNDQLIRSNFDGSEVRRFTTISNDRIVDHYSNGKPVFTEWKLTNNPNSIKVETMQGSLLLNKNTCTYSFYKSGFVSENDIPLFEDSIIPKRAILNTTDWLNIAQINNAACIGTVNESDNNIVLSATKAAADIGSVSYNYIFKNGEWKTELRAINNSTLTNQKFGFDQTISLNRDTIIFGKIPVDLQNFKVQRLVKLGWKIMMPKF